MQSKSCLWCVHTSAVTANFEPVDLATKEENDFVPLQRTKVVLYSMIMYTFTLVVYNNTHILCVSATYCPKPKARTHSSRVRHLQG